MNILTITSCFLLQLWQRAITGSGAGVDDDFGGGGGETMVLSREGNGVGFDVDCCCLTTFGIVSGMTDLVGIRGTGTGSLVTTTQGSVSVGSVVGTGSACGGGGVGGEVCCSASGGAPGGAVGKLEVAFFTSLLDDFSAPDAFSTGYINKKDPWQ